MSGHALLFRWWMRWARIQLRLARRSVRRFFWEWPVQRPSFDVLVPGPTTLTLMPMTRKVISIQSKWIDCPRCSATLCGVNAKMRDTRWQMHCYTCDLTFYLPVEYREVAV